MKYMKNSLLLLLFIIIFFSCKQKEPKYYHSRLYPVIKGEYIWYNNEIFDNIPISIRLESRIDFDDPIYEGHFEPIIKENAILTLDKDIYILSDTIKKQTNLLDYDFVEIETYQVARSGGYIDDSYILWLNKNNDPYFYVNKGYFTVYFSTTTENNYNINDSTVIKIE